jgi:hypothetical protein
MNRVSYLVRHHKSLFYVCWLLLNLIQSSITGLFDDESYYWVYSRFLDWGYFDHPPMVALLIKAGYAISHSELGVRLLIALLSTLTLWLIEKLLILKDDILFYTIAISIAVLQLGDFIAVPDIPLLFFTALFFHAYKKFIERESIASALLLGICMACLLYSKYHAVLVILFTVASNPRLLRKSRTYLAVLIAAILYIPHLYWQYAHGFPSVQYHLKERIVSSYEISTTFEYIFQQLIFVGPASSIVLLWATFRKRPSNEIERALKFCSVGFYLFFLLYSLRDPIEANWTFCAFIGVIVLSHQYLTTRKHLRKLVNVLAFITLIIVVGGRLYLAGALPAIGLKDDEFLFNKEWTNEISKKADGLPVFFVDSYQRASKYWFYSGLPTYSLNTLDYRRNGYNFWAMEDSLQGRKMYAVYQGKHNDLFPDSIPTIKGQFLGRTVEKYFSFSRILFNSESDLEGMSDQLIDVELQCKADTSTIMRIHPAYDTARIWMAVYKIDVDEPLIIPTTMTIKDITHTNQSLLGKVKLAVPKGEYTARLGISSCIPNWPTINSSVIDLRVK